MDRLEYKCNICKKDYSSYKSVWLHNYKYHPKIDNIILSHPKPSDKSDYKPPHKSKISKNNDLKTEGYKCKYCNNIYKHFQSRWKHEQKCSIKIVESKNKDDLIELKLKILQDTLEMKHKQEMEQFKNDLLKTLKIDKKELNKINNQLNLNQQNNINNNNNYFQLGFENFQETLSDKKKLGILNRQANSVNSFVEMIYQNKDFKPYQNVYITNLRSNTAYKYDEKINKFIAVKQKDLIEHLFETRLNDIQQFYDELKDIMDPFKANQMKLFLDRIENELMYRNIKKEEVKLVLYNNKDSVKKVYEEINKEIEL